MARLIDVATEAGLSPAAVSRYLNGRIDLPQATRDRIDAAIVKLGYRPNIHARRLSTGRSESIAIVMPDIANPFFAEVAGGIESEARGHGLSVNLSLTGGDRAREIEAVRALSDASVEGLILSTNRPDDGTLLRLLARYREVVLLDEDIPGAAVPRVFAQNEVGAREATAHLIALGHREIALIGGPPDLMSVRERLVGYRAALAAAGIEDRDDRILLSEYSRAHGRNAALRLLQSEDPPTAIFAASDWIAIGVIDAARSLGLSIPDDLSLVGFDDMAFAALVDLTTVRQPIAELGRLAMQRLAELIAGRAPPRETRVPVDLIRRRSVAAPKERTR